MWRLAEMATELAAEMRAGEPRGAREVVDTKRIGIATVGEILRAGEVANTGDERHPLTLANEH